MSLRVVFCGTPQFAVPSLEALLNAGHEVPLVLVQPDRPSGRGMKLTPPPVKVVATERSLTILQPEKIKSNPDLQDKLREIAPDVIVVVAYGRILPEWMLQLPRLGCVNVHGSLLPAYRGAAPIQWAIANGETVTGITTMQMDAGLDTGDMLLKRELTIEDEWRAPELADHLAPIGAELLIETLDALAAGTVKPEKQNESKATYAPILKREDGRIDWELPAGTICNRWRGFYPWPGAFTSLRGEMLQVREMRLLQNYQPEADRLPGESIFCNKDWLVACGDGKCVQLLEVQAPGKKSMQAADFLRGRTLSPNERLS